MPTPYRAEGHRTAYAEDLGAHLLLARIVRDFGSASAPDARMPVSHYLLFALNEEFRYLISRPSAPLKMAQNALAKIDTDEAKS